MVAIFEVFKVDILREVTIIGARVEPGAWWTADDQRCTFAIALVELVTVLMGVVAWGSIWSTWIV